MEIRNITDNDNSAVRLRLAAAKASWLYLFW